MKLLSLMAVVAVFVGFTAPSFALEVGDKAPCVVLNGVDENGDDHRGCVRNAISLDQEYTVLDFFSVFCSTCQASLPNVNRLAGLLNGVGTVRQVAIDPAEEDIRDYIAEKGELISFPVAFDLERDAKKAYGVITTPTLFVLKKLGPGNYDIVWKHSGLLEDSHVDEIVSLVNGQ